MFSKATRFCIAVSTMVFSGTCSRELPCRDGTLLIQTSCVGGQTVPDTFSVRLRKYGGLWKAAPPLPVSCPSTARYEVTVDEYSVGGEVEVEFTPMKAGMALSRPIAKVFYLEGGCSQGILTLDHDGGDSGPVKDDSVDSAIEPTRDAEQPDLQSGRDAGTTGADASMSCPAGERECQGVCRANDSCCSDSDCKTSNASSSCVSGKCVGLTCDVGFGNCNSSPGCETAVDTVAACGSCDKKCADGETCEARQCVCKQTLCRMACVDLETNSGNCGACLRACPGSCNDGKCNCVVPNPSNLVQNGGFDQGFASWDLDPRLQTTVDARDGGECTSSKSVGLSFANPEEGYFGQITYCVPAVEAGRSYNLGAWARFPSASANGYFSIGVEWSPFTACGREIGVKNPFTARSLLRDSAIDLWRHVPHDNIVPPAGTKSALIRVALYSEQTSSSPLSALVDMIYLTPSPGRW